MLSVTHILFPGAVLIPLWFSSKLFLHYLSAPEMIYIVKWPVCVALGVRLH